MAQDKILTRQLDAAQEGLRLDQAAAQMFPEFSRARLQQWIKDGQLLVDGVAGKVRNRMDGSESLTLQADVAETAHQEPYQAEELPLEVVFEDSELLVIDKPAGLVVHPAAGNYSGTLLNGLLAYLPALANLPRAGIVHRLDKDTSGLLVVAKTLAAHQDLVAQLQARTVSRHYVAVAQGVMTAGGTVSAAIGRHPVQRQKRAVSDGQDAREAITHYRVLERYRSHTYVGLQLETGRTHQIRVHMAHIGYPLQGDTVYGGRSKPPRGAAPELLAFLQEFRRQALHARRLGLRHPASAEYLEWESPLPADMQTLLALLEQDRG